MDECKDAKSRVQFVIWYNLTIQRWDNLVAPASIHVVINNFLDLSSSFNTETW